MDIDTAAEQRTGACTICHRDDPTSGHACGWCRWLLPAQLDELVELHDLLPDEILPGAGRRGGRVTGTPGKSLGVNLTALDLMLPVPTVLDRRRADSIADPYLDQTGPLPVAVWLDQWVRAWLTESGAPGSLPTPGVFRLAHWLARSVGWAADTDPQRSMLDDFAAELAGQLAMLRRVTHMQPIHHVAECTKCDTRSLMRWPLSKYVECRTCRYLFKPGEYDQILTAQANAAVDIAS